MDFGPSLFRVVRVRIQDERIQPTDSVLGGSRSSFLWGKQNTVRGSVEPPLQEHETLALHGLRLVCPVFETQGLRPAGAAGVRGRGIGGRGRGCAGTWDWQGPRVCRDVGSAAISAGASGE